MPWLAGIPRDRVNWGPTIDPDRCVSCGMCMNCGKKVFDWIDNKPIVVRYDDCVVGCTTCGNLCLSHAISFPDIEELRCFDCHEPHGGANTAQIVPQVTSEGVTIPTRNENDTLCLACHATHGPFADITKDMVKNYDQNVDEIGAVVSAHTHHPYAPERLMGLSRCSECHMSSIYNAQRTSELHMHNMVVVPPEKTLTYQTAEEGMPNACAVSCHSRKVNLWSLGIDPDMQIWNEPFDLDTATILEQYFGPEGLWWVKKVEQTQ